MAQKEALHRPLVVSGPSGTGKSTLLNRLFAEFPDTFGFSVSHTTRSPRPGEEDGKQYYFVDRTAFGKMVEKNEFIEHAEFSGNLYGTSIDSVKKVAESGKIAVLDVDMQGVKSVKGTDLNARYVFIKPPSLEILEQRLRGRNTESEEAIKERLAAAKIELDYAEQAGSHDLIVVNDDLDNAYAKLKAYVVEIKGNNGELRIVTSAEGTGAAPAPVPADANAAAVAPPADVPAVSPAVVSPADSKKSKKGKKDKANEADGTPKKSKHCIIL